ncbi:PREDICTED: 5'-AMP-activated protein kinase subunit beta-1-like [Rhagoletis zephyria]|uniref:5'-AMP-activated protein kinase subunit beta-1-like n=1 Tax=Rhagoletis zephyria TaxID=28612 RepID=UPI000811561A|nr:PREDICTED: 5'-AMP-activated protein kinase subunit beta-1-like [Rhagoletis zephyria]
MGNTNAGGGVGGDGRGDGRGSSTKSRGSDRPYAIDLYGSLDRRGDSPRGDETRFDFANSSSSSSGTAPGRRRPVLCYQGSTDYGNEDTVEDYKNHLNSSSQGIGAFNDQKLPTVFKWEGGGKEVFVTGTFSEWKPLKMSQSQGDFVTVVDIPEGVHKFKFVVDGVETVDRNAPLDDNKAHNVMNVKKSDFEVFEALAMDLASNNTGNNKPGSYTQEIPSADGHTGVPSTAPPFLPPHLLQVILNNPSTNFCEPTLLPQPNHVMLNHLYALSIKDGVMVLSAIHRYRKKYVTTLLYKPI